LAMIDDFPANGVGIWGKSARRHNAGVEVAIGALRLAEGDLDVNAEIAHHSKL
jgi:hypothetical protein